MKAVLLDAPGPPSSLRIGELKDPVPAPDEVLVRVHAASLNPVDFKVAAIGSNQWRYPHVLGVDAAGVIERAGRDIIDRQPGDRVFYHTTWRRDGTYAELTLEATRPNEYSNLNTLADRCFRFCLFWHEAANACRLCRIKSCAKDRSEEKVICGSFPIFEI